MLVVRPARMADLDALMELAILSGRGFTSLPEDEETLAERLRLAEASFDGSVAPAEAWYTLMLEDEASGRIEGICGVRAAVGLKRPHFSFRVVTLAQYSPAIQTRFDHRSLVLVNECSGWTEVGSLFVRPERRSGGAGGLLARSRYMLIGAEPLRFSETVMAELRGYFAPDGSCPFWEGVARKFFRLPYDEADRMTMSTNGQFILDLAPRHPIYVDLLPRDARDAIGRIHVEGEAARRMLEHEGFQPTELIDIFDAGPTYSVQRDRIGTIAGSVERRVRIGDVTGDVTGEAALVSTREVARFRAIRAPAAINGDFVVLSAESAAALRVGEGEIVRVRA